MLPNLIVWIWLRQKPFNRFRPRFGDGQPSAEARCQPQAYDNWEMPESLAYRALAPPRSYLPTGRCARTWDEASPSRGNIT